MTITQHPNDLKYPAAYQAGYKVGLETGRAEDERKHHCGFPAQSDTWDRGFVKGALERSE